MLAGGHIKNLREEKFEFFLAQILSVKESGFITQLKAFVIKGSPLTAADLAPV